MSTQTRPDTKVKSFGENIESDLALEMMRVVEKAAIASAHTMGQGERTLSDQVATETMRQTMDTTDVIVRSVKPVQYIVAELQSPIPTAVTVAMGSKPVTVTLKPGLPATPRYRPLS